jgi:hypothetical protein
MGTRRGKGQDALVALGYSMQIKKNRGIGMRELGFFNKALLAKQV